MQRLLGFPFKERPRGIRAVASLSRHAPAEALGRLDLLLSTSPDPEQGLQYFATLQERQPVAFAKLLGSTAGLRHATALFTHSRFLSEALIEHPDWIEPLLQVETLQKLVTPEMLRERLEESLTPDVPNPIELARFRRRQLLPIVVRDVLRLATLPEITAELTHLADVLLEAAFCRIHDALVKIHGVPRGTDGAESYFAIVALGKMGASELNYSSDVDLMFLYSASGETSGPNRISNKEFFQRAAQQLTHLLSTYTPEGMCYRVDLRLRPDGSHGEVCISLEGAQNYYAKRARDWELQMMIKARVAGGHVSTGRALLSFVEPRTYATTLDFKAIEQLSLTRERLNEKLTGKRSPLKKKDGGVDVKLAPGGIRDVEFLVQCLQRLYGGAVPWVRHGGTMLALSRLQDRGLLSGAEYGKLASAYQFFRHLEHRLQFEDDRQTHTLPGQKEALDLLAKRMPTSGGSGEWLLRELENHFANVREIYDRVVTSRTTPGDVLSIPPVAARAMRAPVSNVVKALDQRAPMLAKVLSEAVSQASLQRGMRSFEHFLERLSGQPEVLEKLNSHPDLARRALDLFENSPHFTDELIRTPDLIYDLIPLEPLPVPNDMNELRRWYRRSMMRIQAESVCGPAPIFETLASTSDLAEAVVLRAYELALSSHTASTTAQGQLWVIALGRLGTREFDLASDADLVFVVPDEASGDLPFWTRVAESVIDSITAYTGSGTLFAVDSRLRPNGSDGPLVQTESSVKEYFASRAEAWEGITYMKSRAIAGDPERVQRFLHELQTVDWARYGQSGRSRYDLRQMRMKLEREQGPVNPLKAGRGGYYDIDFLLMYLRLKSAGVFFTVLNTPDRIGVLESLSLLAANEAKFLLDAATFYRALDHGLRILSGHAEGKLPKAEAQREILAGLVKRWSPIALSELNDLRDQTRVMFDKYFA